MKNGKIKKIIKYFLIFLVFIFCINTVNAFDVTDLTGTQPNNASELRTIGNSLITILTAIGIVVSVVVLIVLGLKYMTGSVEEKAEYKKTLMPYVIGAGLVFAASAIAGAIYKFSIHIGS